jgi:stage V sporulation protein K
MTVKPNNTNYPKTLDSFIERYKHILEPKDYEEFVSKMNHENNKAKEEYIKAKQEKEEVTSQISKNNNIPDDDSLEKVMKELNELIGLDEVKKQINELVNLLKVEKIRTEKGIANINITLHSVFSGFPGTGKTTVARLLGRIYKHLGYLKKGSLIETSRDGLVAGFVGQTAIKTNEVIDKSIDGVLFIDEAYSLSDCGNNDFGKEAIDTLIKRMEDNRKNIVVIAAGYTIPMKNFINSNPGLSSRFNRFFVFDHFTPEQLLQVYHSFCKKSDFIITDSAKEKLLITFKALYEKRNDSFGNARTVRNLFERCVQNQANRIVTIKEITNDILQTIDACDVPMPEETVKQVYFTTTK